MTTRNPGTPGLLERLEAGPILCTDGAYAEWLREFGALQQLKLIDSRNVGDDHAFTFLATYNASSLRVQIVLTPDGKIAELDVESQ
jgi:hypothetical protein